MGGAKVPPSTPAPPPQRHPKVLLLTEWAESSPWLEGDEVAVELPAPAAHVAVEAVPGGTWGQVAARVLALTVDPRAAASHLLHCVPLTLPPAAEAGAASSLALLGASSAVSVNVSKDLKGRDVVGMAVADGHAVFAANSGGTGAVLSAGIEAACAFGTAALSELSVGPPSLKSYVSSFFSAKSDPALAAIAPGPPGSAAAATLGEDGTVALWSPRLRSRVAAAATGLRPGPGAPALVRFGARAGVAASGGALAHVSYLPADDLRGAPELGAGADATVAGAVGAGCPPGATLEDACVLPGSVALLVRGDGGARRVAVARADLAGPAAGALCLEDAHPLLGGRAAGAPGACLGAPAASTRDWLRWCAGDASAAGLPAAPALLEAAGRGAGGDAGTGAAVAAVEESVAAAVSSGELEAAQAWGRAFRDAAAALQRDHGPRALCPPAAPGWQCPGALEGEDAEEESDGTGAGAPVFEVLRASGAVSVSCPAVGLGPVAAAAAAAAAGRGGAGGGGGGGGGGGTSPVGRAAARVVGLLGPAAAAAAVWEAGRGTPVGEVVARLADAAVGGAAGPGRRAERLRLLRELSALAESASAGAEVAAAAAELAGAGAGPAGGAGQGGPGGDVALASEWVRCGGAGAARGLAHARAAAAAGLAVAAHLMARAPGDGASEGDAAAAAAALQRLAVARWALGGVLPDDPERGCLARHPALWADGDPARSPVAAAAPRASAAAARGARLVDALCGAPAGGAGDLAPAVEGLAVRLTRAAFAAEPGAGDPLPPRAWQAAVAGLVAATRDRALCAESLALALLGTLADIGSEEEGEARVRRGVAGLAARVAAGEPWTPACAEIFALAVPDAGDACPAGCPPRAALEAVARLCGKLQMHALAAHVGEAALQCIAAEERGAGDERAARRPGADVDMDLDARGGGDILDSRALSGARDRVAQGTFRALVAQDRYLDAYALLLGVPDRRGAALRAADLLRELVEAMCQAGRLDLLCELPLAGTRAESSGDGRQKILLVEEVEVRAPVARRGRELFALRLELALGAGGGGLSHEALSQRGPVTARPCQSEALSKRGPVKARPCQSEALSKRGPPAGSQPLTPSLPPPSPRRPPWSAWRRAVAWRTPSWCSST